MPKRPSGDGSLSIVRSRHCAATHTSRAFLKPNHVASAEKYSTRDFSATLLASPGGVVLLFRAGLIVLAISANTVLELRPDVSAHPGRWDIGVIGAHDADTGISKSEVFRICADLDGKSLCFVTGTSA